MADAQNEAFAGLLSGSYDCVDQIVLNAFFAVRVGRALDDTHLMRMAGRFSRVRAWAG